MKINVLTLFPEMFDGILSNSIIKRAISKGVVSFNIINIRKQTLDKYGRVDTPPVGGGAGLIMKCQPILDSLKLVNKNSHKILLSPRGHTFSQYDAKRFANMDDITIICGHYEGIDERINKYADELLSIGDYILTGGEVPAMAIIDSVTRLLDGAISEDSLMSESFDENLLEYPQYTEPYNVNGDKVPDILYSGNHAAINKWRKKQQLKLTKEHRPDLFEKVNLNKQDKKLLTELDEEKTPNWEKDAIEKGKKFIHK